MFVYIWLKFLMDKGTILLGISCYNFSQKWEELELGGKSKGPGVGPWQAVVLWVSSSSCLDIRGLSHKSIEITLAQYNKHQLQLSAFYSASAASSTGSHLDSSLTHPPLTLRSPK